MRREHEGYTSYSTYCAAIHILNTGWIYRNLRNALKNAWERGLDNEAAAKHVFRELCYSSCVGMDTGFSGARPISKRSLMEIAREQWSLYVSEQRRVTA